MTSFYPKHLRRRYQRDNMRIVARAVLAGFVAKRRTIEEVYGIPKQRGFGARVWEVHWPDGKVGLFDGRTTPALMYLCMVREDGKWLGLWQGYARSHRERALRGEL